MHGDVFIFLTTKNTKKFEKFRVFSWLKKGYQ